MQSGVFHTSYAKDFQLRPTWPMRIRLVLLLIFLFIFPFLANGYWLNLANQIMAFGISAIGLNILVGFTGQISIGHAAFVGLGAYISGLLSTKLGIPFPFDVPFAMAGAGAVGLIFGLPSARLKGLYLAIATLAAQEIVLWFLKHLDLFIVGVGESITIVPQWSHEKLFASDATFFYYWIFLLFIILTVIFAVNLLRSRVGRAFVAVRDQDIAAQVIGVDVNRTKLIAFMVSSMLAGLAGALIAHYRGIVNWERFTVDTSVAVLSMLIIGGLGRVSGSIFGAIFVTLLPAVLTLLGVEFRYVLSDLNRMLPYIQQGAFGFAIIFFLIKEPEGLAKMWKDVKDYFKLWPFSY
jgi:branched-chain amino acid transport system permease protein